MYTEDEKKTLSKATTRLLRKSIKDVSADRTNTPSVLLKVGRFTNVAFNDHERCKELTTLIMASLWSMFDKKLMK